MFARLASFTLSASVSTFAFGQSFMPENDLHLQPQTQASSMSEREFNRIIDQVSEVYKPLMQDNYGARLNVIRAWNDNTVNAYAYQSGNTWFVKMFGGLAKRVTSEGFMIVLCHELGHHLAGFPFTGSRSWAANDGQSDQFATQVCMRKVLGDETIINSKFARSVDPTAKRACDRAWHTDSDRNLCYRITDGSKSIATLLAHGRKVSFDTPDTRRVYTTDMRHPGGQCRLDTFLAGAVCNAQTWEDALIPGKGKSDRNSRSAERESAEVSCHTANGDSMGSRPRCWFAPGI